MCFAVIPVAFRHQNNESLVLFICDVFVLCYHPVEDPAVADHTDPEQWRFYVLPVVGPNVAVIPKELAAANARVIRTGKQSVCQRRPGTLERGLRGRPPVAPLTLSELSVDVSKTLILG